MNFRISIGLVAAVLLLAAGNLRAEHPVSIVKANIYVQKFKTTMQLECYAEDLNLLQGLEPYDDGFFDPNELLDARDDHAAFLAEKIEVINAAGEKLVPKVTNIGPFKQAITKETGMPAEGIEDGRLMDYVINYELEFKHDTPPEFLTVTQNLMAEGVLLPSELQIVIQQAGSEEVLCMIKPKTPRVFSFDWDNVLSTDASEEDRKKWFDAQQDRNLGIASFSSVYCFVYITDTQVRQEVLFPVASLATFFDFENKDESFLEIDEQDSVKPLIEALFSSEQNKVTIDGVEVQPVFDRIDFQPLNRMDFMTDAPRTKVSMYNGRVGIIMSYSTKSPPQSVEVDWNIFNSVVKTVDASIIAYDKAEVTEFSKFLIDDTYSWSDDSRPPLPEISNVDSSQFEIKQTTIPLLSIGLGVLAILFLGLGSKALGTPVAVVGAIGCALAACFLTGIGIYELPASRAKNIEATDGIFAQLHKNVFRAFDYKDEEQIYDALSKSVDGPQLREFYLDVRNSLRVQEKGGAIANIQQVNLEDGKRIEPSDSVEQPAFGYHSRWNLVGTIEHFGHIHERTTEYEADFDVELIDDAWKITSMQSTGQKHGPIKSDPRKFDEVIDLRKKQKPAAKSDANNEATQEFVPDADEPALN